MVQNQQKRKRILITAAGTATAWHICQIIKKYFSDSFEIHLCDINSPELIPSSIYADKFHVVPRIESDGYEEHMYSLLEKEKIQIIIPLIDLDIGIFSQDNMRLKKLNIWTTAPPQKTSILLSNKRNMFTFLRENEIPTPNLYTLGEIRPDITYVIKSEVGFGSRSVKILPGLEVPAVYCETDIIQEVCSCNGKPEITAEVFCFGNQLKIFCRERRETKAGVCTKMVPVINQEIEKNIVKIVSLLPMPVAFCVQFMWHETEWKLIDCNLRLGAGTALSTAIGFQLTRALLTTLLDRNVDDSLFDIDSSVKSVLRVYDEIVMR